LGEGHQADISRQDQEYVWQVVKLNDPACTPGDREEMFRDVPADRLEN